MKKLLVLTVVLILVGLVAWSDEETGLELLQRYHAYQRVTTPSSFTQSTGSPVDLLAGPVDLLGAGRYMGYVSACVDTLADLGKQEIPSDPYPLAYKAVGEYLLAHPAMLMNRAVVLVYQALYAAWPGKKSPG